MDYRLLRLVFTIAVIAAPITVRATRFGYMPLHRLTCPAGYVLVPELSGYTTEEFCVAKYEAKQSGSIAISTATGTPWVSITRDASITACRANGLGYDLITNAQWQAVARSIELVPGNWSSGTVGSGSMNRGHTDNSPANSLAADASDVNACASTGQTCSDTTWDTQRRTHVLGNGQVVWDFSGNVMEWVRDDNATNYGTDMKISQITNSTTKSKFGPSGTYTSLNSGEYGGLGFAYSNYTTGGILRGGDWAEGTDGGVFMFLLNWATSTSQTSFGFRCTYQPLKTIVLTPGTSTWTVPADFTTNNKVECIGGGGRGGKFPTSTAGGGGGAYSRTDNVVLTPGASINYVVGYGGNASNGTGGDSWFQTATTILAKGGNTPTTSTGGAGGVSASGYGGTKYNGGNGGNSANTGGGGGGGGGGPNGTGRNAGAGGTGGGGGGGGGGGTSSSAGTGNLGAGGNGHLGSGSGAANGPGIAGAGANGGGGGGAYGGTAGNGGAGTDGGFSGGGGGGGSYNGPAGKGGAFGGGGGGTYSGTQGDGGDGACIITYTP